MDRCQVTTTCLWNLLGRMTIQTGIGQKRLTFWLPCTSKPGLSLDLIGLPPSLKAIDDFLADTSPQAYEKLVDRLLASPHYGERWGRWWLDVARYADTNGFEKDLPRSIWPYRDWVIKAFNENKRFDQFTVEQLAGDFLVSFRFQSCSLAGDGIRVAGESSG